MKIGFHILILMMTISMPLLAENGDESLAAYNRAVEYHNRNLLDSAKSQYQIATNSQNSSIQFKSLYNLGCLHLKLNEYSQAEEYFARAIKVDGKDYNAKYNYSYAKMMRNQNDKKNDSTQNQSAASENKSTEKKGINQKMPNSQAVLREVKIKEQATLKKIKGNPKILSPQSEKPW